MAEEWQYAALASHVYSDAIEDPANFYYLPDGFTASASESDATTGFFARAYSSTSEIVVSFRGTQFDSAADWGNNIRIALGLDTPDDAASQASQALLFAMQQKAIAEAQGKTFTVVGHSLGGGLAGIVAATLDVDGYGFDPAPFGEYLAGHAIERSFLKVFVDAVKALGVPEMLADLAGLLGDWVYQSTPPTPEEANLLDTAAARFQERYLAGEALQTLEFTQQLVGLNAAARIPTASSQVYTLSETDPYIDPARFDPIDLHAMDALALAIKTSTPGRGGAGGAWSDRPLDGPNGLFRSDDTIWNVFYEDKKYVSVNDATGTADWTALFRIWGQNQSLYERNYDALEEDGLLQKGRAGEGADRANADHDSLHAALVKLGFSVIRDGIIDGVPDQQAIDAWWLDDRRDLVQLNLSQIDVSQGGDLVLENGKAAGTELLDTWLWDQVERAHNGGTNQWTQDITEELFGTTRSAVESGSGNIGDYRFVTVQAGEDDAGMIYATVVNTEAYINGQIIIGGDGGNELTGGSGDDLLIGGTGDDVFYMSAGADIIVGGFGSDQLIADPAAAGIFTAFGGQGSGKDALVLGEAFDGYDITLESKVIHHGFRGVELDAGDAGFYTLYHFEEIHLTTGSDNVTTSDQFEGRLRLRYLEGDATIDRVASTEVPNPEEDDPEPPLVIHEFSVEEAITSQIRTLTTASDYDEADRVNDVILIDGDKQLIGGISFDFDKFDFAYNLGASRYYPIGYGLWKSFDPVMEEGKVYEGAMETFLHITGFFLGIAAAGKPIGALLARGSGGLGGALWTGAFSLTGLAIGVSAHTTFVNVYQPLQSRRYFGIHGEEYKLGPLNEDGTRTLTIILDPDDTQAEQTIVIENWREGDFGVSLDIAENGQGFDTQNGTERDARALTQDDLSEENFSDDYIRSRFQELGIDIPPPIVQQQFSTQFYKASAAVSTAASAPTALDGEVGLFRNGNAADNELGGTDADDFFSGGKGDDLLVGYEGRDVYIFGAGDGADTIIDASVEGGIIRFRDGVDLASVTYEEVPGDGGQTDYLITYGAGDTILIKGWSDLSQATRDAWTFELVPPVEPRAESYEDVPDLSDPTPELVGTAGDDFLQGSDRQEFMDGFAGNDVMEGGGGADEMFGGDGNDILLGGAGRDRLESGAGDDTLLGGIGRDTLRGGSGNDRYVFNIGDGTDTLTDSGGLDTLAFGDSIDPSDIQITRGSAASMTLTLTPTGEQVRITNQYDSDGGTGSGGIDRIEFQNGTVWTRADMEEIYLLQNTTAGDDRLIGFSGRDEMRGGAGNDYMAGAGGADDYFWNRGDGNDEITDGATSSAPDASNRLFLGVGVATGDVTITRGGGINNVGYLDANGDWIEYSTNPDDLYLNIAGADGGIIEINGFFSGNGVNLVIFADGTVWTREYVYERSFEEQITDGDDRAYGTPGNDVIDGGLGDDRIEDREGDDIVIGGDGDDRLGYGFNSDGDDTFIGGAGNDTLEGGSGRDTYIFGAGFGHDRVRDSRGELAPASENRMVFTDHSFDDFTFQATGDEGLDLLMTTTDGLNSVYVDNWIMRKWVGVSGGWGEIRWQSLGEFEFADGQVVSSDQIAAIANISGEIPNGQAGTTGNDTLDGTSNRDRLDGRAGDDTLSGGDGGDYLIGGDGQDLINGDAGDDVVSGGAGIDTVDGGAGGDLIFGGAGNDIIDGGTGDDFASGGTGDDVVSGGAGNDRIEGDGGDDTLSGGAGNDTVVGQAGSDTYVFNFGDGQDVIDMRSGRGADDVEVLQLGPGLTLDIMRPVFVNAGTFTPGGLQIKFANGTADQILIKDALRGGLPDEIRFDDGQVMTGQELLAWAVGATADDDSPAAFVTTEDGYRQIQYGGAGNDFLTDLNDDTYVVFGRGDGDDRIFVRDGWFLSPSYDVQVLIQDYTPEETIVRRGGPENDDLIISFTTGDETLTDINHFGWAGIYNEDGIDSVRFADGTVWNASRLAQLAGDASGAGSGADDTIDGTSADETFDGGGGSDTYHYAADGGSDVIADSDTATDATDTLAMGAGIAPQDISVNRNGDDIVLAVGTESITLAGQLSGDGRGIERITFQNGDVWTRADLVSRLVAGQASGGDDALTGGDGDETLSGGAGNDTLTGGAGGDTYTYGAGDGDDVIVESADAGTDRLTFDASIDSQTTVMRRDPGAPDDLLIEIEDGAMIRVRDQFADGGLEQVRFADGTILGREAILGQTLAGSQTDGDDTVVGTDGGDTIRAGAGSDLIDGGLGADLYTYALGDGADVIADTGATGEDGIALADGITSDDVTFARSGDDLVITFPASPGDQLTVTDHFNGHTVSGILFSDGALWSPEMIDHMAENGTMLPGAEPLMLPVPSSGPLEPQLAIEDAAFSYDIPGGIFQDVSGVTAALVDGDPLPAWLDLSNGTFSGTPAAADAALLEIVLSGTGTDGNPRTETLYLGVTDVNDAPVTTGDIPDTEVLSNEDMVLDLSTGGFADEDDAILFTTLEMADGSDLPSWLTFDPDTMTISGRPPSNSVTVEEGVRDFELRLIAEDDAGLTASHDFTLSVRWRDPTRVVTGTEAGETLSGNSGSEIFYAGAGDDTIRGGGGRDVYVYNSGDGRDYIDNAPYSSGGSVAAGGTIRLGAGISPDDLVLNREGYVDPPPQDYRWEDYYWEDLHITFVNSPGDEIVVEGQFGELQNGLATVSRIEFDDGTVWKMEEMLAPFIQPGAEVLGSGLDDVLIGNGADEVLAGWYGDDVIDGGAGDDWMFGWEGDDTYLFGYGSGNDRITDLDSDTGTVISVDTVRFGPGITPDDLTYTVSNTRLYTSYGAAPGGHLTIGLKNSPGDTLLLNHQYAFQIGRSFGIDFFEFDDGTVLSLQELDALMAGDGIRLGTTGADTMVGTTFGEHIIGGLGDDYLQGGLGDDVYVWNPGDGNDTIYESDDRTFDVLELGGGITASDIALRRGVGNQSPDMYVDIIPTGETILIDRQFQVSFEEFDPAYSDERLVLVPVIDEIRFSDGSAWNYNYIRDFFTTGTPADQELYGYEFQDDVMDGGAGDDVLYGYGGDDIYVFGRGYGNDQIDEYGPINIWEEDLNTIRLVGDILPEDILVERIDGPAAQSGVYHRFTIRDTGEHITIVYDIDRGSKLQYQIEFQDAGIIWEYEDIVAAYVDSVSTDGDDIYRGSSTYSFSTTPPVDTGAGDDTFYYTANDNLSGGAGSDTYLPSALARYGVRIEDNGGAADVDRLELSEGWDFSQISVQIDNNGRDLILRSGSYPDPVVLVDMAVGTAGLGIEEIVFQDGTVTDGDWLRAIATASTASATVQAGTAGADTLSGASGVDTTFDGGLGDDVMTGSTTSSDLYIWRPGDGNDVINEATGANYRTDRDIVRLDGVSIADVQLTVEGDDLFITYLPTGERIEINDHFDASISNGYRAGVEEIIFEDGRYYGRAAIDAAARVLGTSAAERLDGSYYGDTFFGAEGDDILVSGGSWDEGDSEDKYLYRAGDGNDWIYDQNRSYDGYDRVPVKEDDQLVLLDLNREDIRLSRVGYDLRVDILPTGERIMIDNQFYSTTYKYGIEEIVFADGSKIEGRSVIAGLAQYRGDAGNNTVTGNSSSDDILVGEQGNDLLRGRSGDDTYQFSAGDGADTIQEYSYDYGSDRIVFDATVTPGDVTFARSADGDDLIVQYGTGDTITVLDHLIRPWGEIDAIVFDDGTEWDQAEIVTRLNDAGAGDDQVTGSANDDVLAGLGGDDVVTGLGGQDVYDYALGDGNDIIRDGGTDVFEIDVLRLGAGILPEEVEVSRDGDNIVLTITATGHTITLENRLVDVLASADAVSFADGTYWDYQALLNLSDPAAGNLAPVAVDDAAITDYATPIVFDVADLLANDSDPEGDALTITSVIAPSGGNVEMEGTTITFTPAVDFGGTAEFIYVVSDIHGATSTATVRIDINIGANQVPVAVADTATLAEDGTILVDVLANDSDPDGDPLVISAISGATNGLAMIENGQIRYAPDPDFSGQEVLTYTISDGLGGITNATLTLTITPEPDAPSGADDAVVMDEGGTVLVDVLANDTDADGDSLTLVSVSGATGGVAVIESGQVRYTPDPDFFGIEVLTYTLDDGNGGSDSATLTITVNEVNDPPVAGADTAEVDEEGTVLIDVIANDSDANGDPLTLVSVGTPANGTATVEGNQLRYTPDYNFSGTDTVSYTVADGRGGSTTGTVEITVNPVNDAPIGFNDTATTPEDTDTLIDVLSNDIDVDGDTLAILSVDSVLNGTAMIEGDQLRYTPDADFSGSDTITYTVSDEQGGTDTATVQIDVTPVEDDPVAVDDTATVEMNGVAVIDVLANDYDPEGDFIYVSWVSAPIAKSIAIENGMLVYEPLDGFTGSVELTYTVSSVNGGSANGTVFLDVVAPTGSDPVAADDTATVEQDGSVLIDVLANDNDPDGDTLSIVGVSAALNGTAVIENGQIRYTADPGYVGSDTLSYTISDGNGGTSTASIDIDVTPLGGGVVAVDDTATVEVNGLILIDVLANDYDPQGGFLYISWAYAPIAKDIAIENGMLRYEPFDGYIGPVEISYTVGSTSGGSSDGTVFVDVVAATNDAPVAADDAASVAEDGTVLIDVLANDTDADGDSLTLTDVTGAANGTAVIEGGQIRYTPDADYHGSETLTYTVIDGNGGTGTATIAITVDPVNDAPVTAGEAATVDEGADLDFQVLSNDTDADGDSLLVQAIEGQAVAVGDTVTLASGASVELMAGGTLRFVQNGAFDALGEGETAQETFSYTVADGNGGTADAAVTVTIDGQDMAAAPIGESGSIAVAQSGPDQWHAVTFSTVIPNAVVVLGPLTYADGEPATTRVRNVTDTGFEFQIDEWDYLDGTHGTEALGWLAVSEGTHTLGSGQRIVAGTSSVGTGFSTQAFGETLTNAVVLSEVTSVNDPDAVATRMRNVTATGFDVQIEEQELGDAHVAETVSWIAIESGTDGNLQVFRTADQLDERVDRFDFATAYASDPVILADLQSNDGGDTSVLRISALDPTGVSLFVEEEQSRDTEVGHTNETAGIVALGSGLIFAGGGTVNSDPVAANDSTTLAEDGTVLVDVMANDSDPDGDPLTLVSVSGAVSGVAVIEGGQIRYTPDADFHGAEVLTYTVADGLGGTAMATLAVTIDPVNDGPLAVDDAANVAEDAALIIDVLANDNDADGDALTITAIEGQAVFTGDRVVLASGAEVELLADGTVAYHQNGVHDGLAAGQSAVQAFSYTVSDGQGGTDQATATVTVDGVTDGAGPVGQAGSVTVVQNNATQWHSVSFDQSITDAVVVMGPVDQNGNQATVTRVRNVTDSGFEYQVDEWDYLDGGHIEVTIGWMAVSAGTHVLANGLTVVAGTSIVGDSFSSIDFGTSLSNAIVLSEVTTTAEPDAVTTRTQNVGDTGFEIRLQEEEAKGAHVDEEVSWIAIETGSSAGFESVLTPKQVDQVADDFVFTSSFASTPVLIADMQSYAGSDPAALRYGNLDSTGVSIFVQEEQSSDSETGHVDEVVGYLAIEEGFIL